MSDIVSEDVRRFLTLTSEEPDAVQREMQDLAAEEGFPIIGPEVGTLLSMFARMVDAKRVFEFGSGFGYSGSWFSRALPADGRIVMTEIDEDELEQGRAFFDRAGYAPESVFELGDAVEIVDSYDGPFDVVLIDHQKSRYVDAFEKVREKVAPGGVVITDNIMRGPIDFDDVLAGFEDGYDGDDGTTRGVVDYLHRVHEDPGFESSVLPTGSGVSVSVKRE